MDAQSLVKVAKAPNLMNVTKAVLKGGYAQASDLISNDLGDIKKKLTDLWNDTILPSVSNTISNKVDNRTKIKIYDKTVVEIDKKTRKEHAEDNQKKLDKNKTIDKALEETGYIENQGVDGSGWDKIKYGVSDLDSAGCGIFATYNTLIALGVKVTSNSLINSGEDATLDSVISASTLVAAGIFLIFHISLEAWLGAIISVIIIKSGIEMLRDTISQILGERNDTELAKGIHDTVVSYP